jgi:hypothetical protein
MAFAVTIVKPNLKESGKVRCKMKPKKKSLSKSKLIAPIIVIAVLFLVIGIRPVISVKAFIR